MQKEFLKKNCFRVRKFNDSGIRGLKVQKPLGQISHCVGHLVINWTWKVIFHHFEIVTLLCALKWDNIGTDWQDLQHFFIEGGEGL